MMASQAEEKNYNVRIIITEDLGISERNKIGVCWTSSYSWPRGSSQNWNNIYVCQILLHGLLSFFPAQWDHRGDPFGKLEDHLMGCDNEAEEYPRRILSAAHKSVEEKDGNVH